MVTIILVSDSNKEVIYKFLDGNDNYKGQITVNKSDLADCKIKLNTFENKKAIWTCLIECNYQHNIQKRGHKWTLYILSCLSTKRENIYH